MGQRHMIWRARAPRIAGAMLLLTVAALVTGCSSTAYDKPVQTLKTSLGAFTTARSGYAATYNTSAEQALAVIDEARLYAGVALLSDASCKAQADAAVAAADPLVGAGQPLDRLYTGDGTMAVAKVCAVDFVLPTPPAAPRLPAAAAFNATAAAAEADADTATCMARQPHKATPAAPSATAAPKPADADALWKAVDAYANGLASLSDTASDTAFKNAATGAATAVKSLGAPLKNSTFGPAVDLLAVGFEAAVEQKRYEALKTAVVCANPVFIRLRGALRDSLRYEQITAFRNLATRFDAEAAQLHNMYDPADCAPAPSRSGCLVTQAQQILKSASASPEQRFAASAFLQDRAARLKTDLTAAQADAHAAMATAAADPAGAVDAFIAAHRALRLAIINNDGQLEALVASASDLSKAAEALAAAAKPAAAKPAVTAAKT
jgi:hypothetical protein